MSTHGTRTPAGDAAPDRWTRARLVEPSTAGFIHIGASSGPWRLPVPLPRARRRAILASMRETAAELRRDPRVVRADVFRGALRPPGRRRTAARDDAPDADFDAVLLVETTSVATATEVSAATALTRLRRHLDRAAVRTLAFVGANARRLGPVDHERQGVFLFNYFSADSVETNLYAWQYTAGWFQDRTGLDNSTVLQPVDPDRIPYRLVNHCRWDRWRDILPSLVLRPSFRGFVLRVFEENRVAPRPILYRLHGSR